MKLADIQKLMKDNKKLGKKFNGISEQQLCEDVSRLQFIYEEVDAITDKVFVCKNSTNYIIFDKDNDKISDEQFDRYTVSGNYIELHDKNKDGKTVYLCKSHKLLENRVYSIKYGTDKFMVYLSNNGSTHCVQFNTNQDIKIGKIKVINNCENIVLSFTDSSNDIKLMDFSGRTGSIGDILKLNFGDVEIFGRKSNEQYKVFKDNTELIFNKNGLLIHKLIKEKE